jgi:hypothetical protein
MVGSGSIVDGDLAQPPMMPTTTVVGELIGDQAQSTIRDAPSGAFRPNAAAVHPLH